MKVDPRHADERGPISTVAPITIAAAVVRDDRGRVLLVRKRGTRAFMQPGGKIEDGEEPEAALRREIAEELGVGISSLRPMGSASAPAANEPGCTVQAKLFAVELVGSPTIGAEIAEAVWVDSARPRGADGEAIVLAPLTKDHVLARFR